MPAKRLRLLLPLLLLALAALPAPACDADSDCGVGGTCIKREKRARGVCYGGSMKAAPEPRTQAPTEHAGRSINLPPGAVDVLGDPETLIRQQLPGRAIGGVCIVTQDCPAGLECVSNGIEGRCVAL